ncbi:hypothetical protein I4U23_014610 [Adineta vaga]|nr:hypothetical protein I4U23_014610 [Adineta vaga]
MFNPQCEITLVSQLLDSIDGHLKLIHLPMKQNDSSQDEEDGEEELWLSGHRSIFSSYESHCRQTIPSLRDSQYEDFHWDLYGNEDYHRLAFEYGQKNRSSPTHLSEWSMQFDSDNIDDENDDGISSSNRQQTSWQAIKTKSIDLSCSSTTTNASTSDSGSYSPNPLTLYHLFRCKKSQQHPCRLYQNFSDKSLCDSLTSSSSSSSISHHIPKLKSPTTISQLNLINSKQDSKTNVDQCQQTSLMLCQTKKSSITHSKSPDRLLNHPSSQSSFISDYTLPDLDFLTYYAKENPPKFSTHSHHTQHSSLPMNKPFFELLTHQNKSQRTIFYCHIPLSTRHLSFSKEKFIKPNPTTISVCSSTSSSGYFSNCSTNHTRPIQTPLVSYPLKSCLKRTKTEDSTKANVLAVGIVGDVFTLTNGRMYNNKTNSSEHRRYSAPSTSSQQEQEQQQQSLPLSTKSKTCNPSEHDLGTKKSVSFCDEITRRLITPSTSPKFLYQDICDLLPRENLTDSPPSEFNLSDNDDNDKDEDEDSLVHFITNTSEDIIKPLPIKNGSEKHLIDAFAHTILRILEIKCNDPKAYYLNNQTNPELDRILRLDFCPLIRAVLEDGLRQHSGSLFSRKVNLWRLIDLTTPSTSRFNEAKMKVQIESSANTDWVEKFNSFIYQLLNLHELAAWLTDFVFHRTLLKTYYESWAFVLVNMNNDLFECITNQVEKLSPLSFRLKYTNLSNSRIVLTNQKISTSILPKKFNVRTWLRDRKTQVKISPRDALISSRLSTIPQRQKSNSIPITNQHAKI